MKYPKQLILAEAPIEARARELWLQHAAGLTLFHNVRTIAIGEIDAALGPEAQAAARKAIDDALYGLMMVIDGVIGGPSNERYEIELKFHVQLHDRVEDKVIDDIDLFHGDGMCMGYHFWMEGDYGENPVTIPK